MSDLPTKPGPYWFLHAGSNLIEQVLVSPSWEHDRLMVQRIGVDYQWYLDEFLGGQWLPIPTAEELVQLLRLVDEVTGWENDLIDTNEFPVDGEAMINDIGNLREYAAILRKEMES
jgi:hypothetical protein